MYEDPGSMLSLFVSEETCIRPCFVINNKLRGECPMPCNQHTWAHECFAKCYANRLGRISNGRGANFWSLFLQWFVPSLKRNYHLKMKTDILLWDRLEDCKSELSVSLYSTSTCVLIWLFYYMNQFVNIGCDPINGLIVNCRNSGFLLDILSCH